MTSLVHPGPLTGDDAELFAAVRLVATRTHPYFAAALFAMAPRAAPGTGTFAVDRRWRLYIDPAVLRRWTVPEAAAVLVHEVHHLVRDHMARADALGVVDHRVWNIAADAAINDDLVAEGLPLPSPVLPCHLGVDDGGFEEGYYLAIGGAVARSRETTTAGLPTCGSGAGGEPSAAEIDAADGGDDGGDDAVGVNTIEAQLIRQVVASETIAAQARGEGVGDGLLRWARTFGRPQVRWQRVLRSAVRHSLQSTTGTAIATHARPDRRADSRPGFVYPGTLRRRASVAVVVDTSGSMDTALLDAALAEIDGICAGAGAGTAAVISCDTRAHAAQRVRSAAVVELAGGGGTDMRVGIRAAAELRPRVDVIVVLTDALTPWPDAAPRGTRVVAVVIGDQGDEPRGRGITAVRIIGHQA